MGQIRAAAEVRRDGMDGVGDELDGLGEAENEKKRVGHRDFVYSGRSQERRRKRV